MDIKRGIAVSPGVAIGPALVLDSQWSRVPRRTIDPTLRDDELLRLREGLKAALDETRAKQEKVNVRLGNQYGAIFGAHALLIDDPGLQGEVEQLIREKGYAAEYAYSHVLRDHARMLEGIGGPLAGRAADLYDIEKTVLASLLGQRREQLRHLEQSVVVVARDLSPSETAALDPQHVHAFATESGGRASHTAILAGVLGIPAVVGVGSFIDELSSGDRVIVDGNRGLVVVDPDDATLVSYQRELQSFLKFERSLEELREMPAITLDGTHIALLGNIEFPDESAECLRRGADGVGLYRTEFLYLDRQSDPTEEDHYRAYLTVVRTTHSRPVVIRTLDLGADKLFGPEEAVVERNPFLGVRSVRLCLRNLALFKTQIRAILRASAEGDVRILFPMVSTLVELRQCKMILAEVKEDLEDEGVPFNSRLAVGTMIEVPSAAILADLMAREVDFFSIGTNDLVQYTLAADRNNEAVSGLYNPGDPAVLRLIEHVVQAGQRHGVKINVCGEMSGDPTYSLLLLGLGLRQLSLAPHHIPEIKKVIRSVTLAEAEQLAREVMRMETARDVNNYLRERTRRIVPELLG